ncbi:hypothetical protein [Stenoxybacter acetivorans]|uniref:hypothetical protein n=1 Tax=Stenoxybacter acetivorans TaxID=422441 RepID=UPI00056C1CA6|nr:hypothetical protein [Stenoxybacter acetivorans]
MSIAHIVIEFKENPETAEHQIRLVYSGGNDLVLPESAAAFAAIVEKMAEMLGSEQSTNNA